MSKRRNKRSGGVLPREIEEQKRIHHWKLLKKKFRPVPCKAQRARDPAYYCLLVTHLGGVPVPDPLQDIDPHLSIRVSLFDLGSRQFFGNTWCSTPGVLPGVKKGRRCRVSASGILDVPRFELPLYLYTYINDPNCAAIVEFVISEVDSASGMIVQSFGVGWTVVTFFGSGKADLNGRRQVFPVYAGSPRSLLLLPTDVRRWEDAKDTVSPLMKAAMSAQTIYFDSMESCVHLLPCDVLVSANVSVPGIKSKRSTLPAKPLLNSNDRRHKRKKKKILGNRGGGVDDDGATVALRSIKLHRRSPLKITGLKILMPFGFEERFEDDVTTIAELSVEKKDRTNWEICDRWLDLGVHNSMRLVPFTSDVQKRKTRRRRRREDDTDASEFATFCRVPLRHGGDSKDSNVDGFFLRESRPRVVRLSQFVNHSSFALVGVLCYKARRLDTGARGRQRRGTSARAIESEATDKSANTSLSPLSEITFQVATFVFLPVRGDSSVQTNGYFNFVAPVLSHAMRSGVTEFDAKRGDTKRPLEIWMMPPIETMNLAPDMRIYDGWIGNGRVVMLGMSMKGKGHRLKEIRSDSDGDDADDSDFDIASSSDDDDGDHSDDFNSEDGNFLDSTPGVPSWLRVGAKVDARKKPGRSSRWYPAVVETIALPEEIDEEVRIDVVLQNGETWVDLSLSQIRRRGGVDASASVVSSVNTAYVRDMALRAKAVADGRELPPELAMAADALKLRLHGNKGKSDGNVIAPTNALTTTTTALAVRPPTSSVPVDARTRPLTRATSTTLSRSGFVGSRPPTSSINGYYRQSASARRANMANRRRWRSLHSPLLSVPPDVRKKVVSAVKNPLQKHSVSITFAAWRASKKHPGIPCAVTLRCSLFNSRPRNTPPLELVYAQKSKYRGSDSKRSADSETSEEEEEGPDDFSPLRKRRSGFVASATVEEHLWFLVPQENDEDEGLRGGAESKRRRHVGTGSVGRSMARGDKCVLRFDVDAGAGGVEASWDFNTYLATKTMFVEVWDAESLLPIGCAAIPLCGLLRGNKTRASIALEADVVTSSRHFGGEDPIDVVQGMVVGDASSGSAEIAGRLEVLAKNVGSRSDAATSEDDWGVLGPRPKQPASASAAALLDVPTRSQWGRIEDRSESRPAIRVRARCIAKSIPRIKDSLHESIEDKERANDDSAGGGDRVKTSTMRYTAHMNDGASAATILTREEVAALISGLGLASSDMALTQNWAQSRPLGVRRDTFIKFVMGYGSEGLRTAMHWVHSRASDLEAALANIDRDGSGVVTREGFLYEAYQIGGVASSDSLDDDKEGEDEGQKRDEAEAGSRDVLSSLKPTRQELAILASEFEHAGAIRYDDLLRVCRALPSTMQKLSRWFESEILSENDGKHRTRSSACNSLRRRLTRALSPDGSGLASSSDVRKEFADALGLTLRGPHWEVVARLLRPPEKYRIDSRSLQFCGIVDLASGRAARAGSARAKVRVALEKYIQRTGDAFRELFDHRGLASSLFTLLSSLGVSVLSGFGRRKSADDLIGRQLARLDRSTEFINGFRAEGEEKEESKKKVADDDDDDDGDDDKRGDPSSAALVTKNQLVDLETVKRWRARRKRKVAEQMLRDALSWVHHIHAYFGRVSFFELPFVNPLNKEERFRVTFEDSELRLVSNTEEWQAYRDAQFHMKDRSGVDDGDDDDNESAVEDAMFVPCGDGRTYEFVLAARERVRIPFVLCALSQDTALNPYAANGDDRMYRNISVNFECTSTARTALLLDIVVHLSRPVVHRVLRLHVPENNFMCRTIRLKLPSTSRDGLFVYCPNRDVAIETAVPENDVRGDVGIHAGTQTFVIKYHCGTWPSVAQFFVAFYADKYHAKLWEVWRVVVHSMRVVDTRGTLGQSVGTDLLIVPPTDRRHRRRRLVRCYSSISTQVEFEPRGLFHLMPRSVTKCQLYYRPRRVGESLSIVHAVDVERRALVGAWILRANVTAPPVTKEFDVTLTLGERSTKRIAYTNQWDAPRVFLVTTNEPSRIHVKTPRLALAARGRMYMRLAFPPCNEIADMQMFVFVNRQDGQIEECLLFRVSWRP
eukprot:g147.t1